MSHRSSALDHTIQRHKPLKITHANQHPKAVNILLVSFIITIIIKIINIIISLPY